MRRSFCVLNALILCFCALLLTSCSRNPSVRKQKYFQSGQKYFAQGKYREAAIQFENAILVDGRFAAAHYQLAQTYIQLRDGQNAYLETERTVELQPDNYKAHVDLVNMFAASYASTANSNELHAAQEHVDFLLAKQPNDPDTHMAIANLLSAQQKYPEAIGEVQRAIALGPNRGDSYLILALIETKVGQFDAAEADYKRAVDLTAIAANPRLALAAFYQLRGRYPEAEQQINNAISSDPKDLNARVSLAKLYLVEGKKTEADALLVRVKHDFPDNSDAYRMLADYYFAEGDTDRALTEYASLHNAHPKDLLVSKNYIQLLLMKNRLDDANKLNEKLLSSNARDVDTLLYRGEIQLRQGKEDEAIRTLQAIIEKNPDVAVAHYQLGLAFNQRGELDRAIGEWQQAVRIQPTMTDAYRILASFALRRGDMESLEQYANELIHLEPAATEGYAFRAGSFMARKQFAAAEADARKAIEVAPQSSVGYFEMGSLTAIERNIPAAENWYEQALAHDPNSLDALDGLANLYLAQKQPDKAIDRVNAQLTRSPNSSTLYDLLGSLESSKGNLPAAATAFQKAAELNKHDVGAMIKLGQIQAATGNADQALATWLQGARANPRESAFHIMSGRVYEQKHDLQNARISYEKAYALKPDDPVAANNLAYVILETNGNLDTALELAQSARRALPESPDVADTLGMVLYRKGINEAAIALFQEALKLAAKYNRAENPMYHYHLGLAYEKAEKPAEARQHFERVLKIDPNYSDAADIRKQLAQLKS